MVSNGSDNCEEKTLNWCIGPKNATVVTTSAMVLLATLLLVTSALTLALVTVSYSAPVTILEC